MTAQTVSIPVEVRPVAELVPYERNARRHSASAVRKLANIILDMGWTGPILADEHGIVAGHKRRLAAMLIYEEGGTIRLPGGDELPEGTVPVIDCSGWSEAQRRAYILADNQTTLESEWDEGLLKLELSWLEGAGFDLSLTGFDGDALAATLGAGAGEDGASSSPLKVRLADRFGVPPFSILRAAEGWWQNRKEAWLQLGIMSELGRGEGDQNAAPGGSPLDRAKAARKANATPGGSAMPATNYGKSKARGDGKGRAMGQTEDLRGGLTHRTTTDHYRAKAKT